MLALVLHVYYTSKPLQFSILYLHTTKMSMSIEECQAPRPGFPRPVPEGPSNVLDQFSMKGKVVIVTGAAEGIGGAVADAIAEAGGDVALWYNS